MMHQIAELVCPTCPTIYLIDPRAYYLYGENPLERDMYRQKRQYGKLTNYLGSPEYKEWLAELNHLDCQNPYRFDAHDVVGRARALCSSYKNCPRCKPKE